MSETRDENIETALSDESALEGTEDEGVDEMVEQYEDKPIEAQDQNEVLKSDENPETHVVLPVPGQTYCSMSL